MKKINNGIAITKDNKGTDPVYELVINFHAVVAPQISTVNTMTR